MKRAAIFVLFALPTFAAFNIRTQWDVRTTATAADVNGGGFAPGLGAKDVTAAANLAVDATNNKKVTSASHNFVAGDVGKFINVTAGSSGAGWVTGYYQILSTASNAATLDLSPAPVSATSGTYDLYSGIDYSQQNATQQAYTDIVVGGTTTTATSVAHAFTADMVGNIINITAGAGCTVQRVQMISLAVAVATFDKSLGTAASTCTGNLGGAFITIGAANTIAIASNTIHIKAGTYTLTTALAVPVATITWVGFGTNHYDGGTRPLLTTATNSTDIITTGSNAGIQIFDNLSMSNTAGTRAAGFHQTTQHGTTQTWVIRNCILDGFETAVDADNGVQFDLNLIVVNATEIKNSTNYAIRSFATGSLLVDGSYLHGGAAALISTTNPSVYVSNSILADATNNAVILGETGANSPARFVNVSFANNGAIAISGSTATTYTTLINTIIYGPGGGASGISIPASNGQIASMQSSRNNCFKTTGGNGIWSNVTSIFMTGDPFTNAATGDYSLNATAGRGAACKSAGFQGIFPGATSTGSMSVGAVQPTAGAASTAYNGAFAQ